MAQCCIFDTERVFKSSSAIRSALNLPLLPDDVVIVRNGIVHIK